jgi:hypothetical protein
MLVAPSECCFSPRLQGRNGEGNVYLFLSRHSKHSFVSQLCSGERVNPECSFLSGIQDSRHNFVAYLYFGECVSISFFELRGNAIACMHFQPGPLSLFWPIMQPISALLDFVVHLRLKR